LLYSGTHHDHGGPDDDICAWVNDGYADHDGCAWVNDGFADNYNVHVWQLDNDCFSGNYHYDVSYRILHICLV
jgi:hypothetical protein